MNSLLKAAVGTLMVAHAFLGAMAQTPWGAGSGAAGAGNAPGLAMPVIVSPPSLKADRADSPAVPGMNDAMQDRRQRGPETAPNEPRLPNEFQRFVYSATGQALPLFGAAYFGAGAEAATYAPVDRMPVPADYTLGPGDELQLRGWGAVDIDLKAVVDRNGQISIPRVGMVGVAGLRAGEIEGHLRQQIGKVFKGFNLNVTLGQLRSIQVFVVGQAQRPGTYTLSSLSTLVNAVFASGGPGPNGSMRRVTLRRAGQVATELDLYDFIVKGDLSKDQRLQSGDVIVFAAAGPRVAVLGTVDNPAIFELAPGGTSAGDILGLAGAGRAVADLQHASLERLDPSTPKAPRQVERLDLRQATATRLRDGDVITLRPAAPQFANAVTLRGNVANPLRHPHAPGMRISDLIPDRDALVTRDYHLRKNRLVQYLDPKRLEELEDARRLQQESRTGTAPRPAEAESSRRAGAKAPSLVNPFDQDVTARTLLQLADREPAARPAPGERLPNREGALRNLVDEPNWEYATVERLDANRVATRLLSFHLGKAVLDRDPAHNLELQPGDVVTIFGRQDLRGPQARTTRLVRVEGEVERPGVYQLEPGDTLRNVLTRAGGITGQAYLFGTEFSRESTRQRQAEALQDAVRRLEASLGAAGANQIANLGNADAATVARLQAAEQESRRSQLNRLKTLQPNGRISLELEPAMARSDDLPDLPLEDGDALVVPTRPGFVFAVGAVANENALLWRTGRTVKDYLASAGVLPDADEANIFVARADGSVVHSRARSGGFFGTRSKLEDMVLAPGDTIMVPDLLNRETTWNAFVRGAKDWTQILSNFGIAAAAIKTLRN